MIYKVIKDNKTFEIEDTVFFDRQPQEFRELFNKSKLGDMAEFDNCYVLVLNTNRVIISEKEVSDGK